MASSQQNNIILYLTETIEALKKIKDIVGKRNKTNKFKAIASMLSIIQARMEAGLNYARAGGQSSLDVTMHQQMYNPIIDWLCDEVGK